jgi:phosphoribosylformylglycinamidine cyclo-ligase
MSEESLTYRSSGVDVEANLQANRRIQASTLRTYNERVLTRGGLFGGAIGLKDLPQRLKNPVLAGRLRTTGGRDPERTSREIALSCRPRASDSELPLAFLDYLAAARLDADRAADLVEIFSREFEIPPKIPIIGGETAEMPDVFLEKNWEVVGALFTLSEAEAGEAEVADAPCIDLRGLLDPQRAALVFSMDGVGTKTKLGVMARRTSGLALDIIHHSLNDILCQGARGIGLMLYVGCRRRDEQLIEPLIAAARQCCHDNDLVLFDCLVAEKPSLYRLGEIDVCGAIVGAVEADRLIQGDAIRTGDLLIGLASSGLHTNGYSLARKALLERGALGLDQRIPELGGTLGEVLLEPHRNYAPAVLPLLADPESAAALKGIAHITGGGLKDNIERILPGTVRAEILPDSWQPPPIFELIRRCGNIPRLDSTGKGMYESFNMGIGLVLVAAPEQGERILGEIRNGGIPALVIGRVVDLPPESSARKPAGRNGRVVLL